MSKLKIFDLTKIDLTKAYRVVSLAIGLIQISSELPPKPYFTRDFEDIHESEYLYVRIYQMRGNKYLLLINQSCNDGEDKNIAAGLESRDFIYLLSVLNLHVESYIYSKYNQILDKHANYRDVENNALKQKLAKAYSGGYELAINNENLLKAAETDPSLKKYCNIDNKLLANAINNDGKQYRLISLPCFDNCKSNHRIYFYYVKKESSIQLTLIAVNEKTSTNTIIEISENDMNIYDGVSKFVSGLRGKSRYELKLTCTLINAIWEHVDAFNNGLHIQINNQSSNVTYYQDLKNVYIISYHNFLTTIPSETAPIKTFEKAIRTLPLIDKIQLFSTMDVIKVDNIKSV